MRRKHAFKFSGLSIGPQPHHRHSSRFPLNQCIKLTECSSSLTSKTVPSLNSHLTTSVSSETPLTVLALDSLVQKAAKSGSLIRCQTLESGAGMIADSVTEVEVGIEVDMVNFFSCG